MVDSYVNDDICSGEFCQLVTDKIKVQPLKLNEQAAGLELYDLKKPQK